MRERQINKSENNYEKNYNTLVKRISSNVKNGLDLNKTFVILLKDTNDYPRQGSFISLSSDYTYLYESLSARDEDKDPRVFNDDSCTFEYGLTNPRYLYYIDNVENGKMIVFDELENVHEFSDMVTVTEIYLYPASKHSETFKEIDFENDKFAIKLSDVLTTDEIYKLIDNSPVPFYERSLFRGNNAIFEKSKEIYISRGISFDDGVRVVRVRFENCVINGLDTYNDEFINYSIEVLDKLVNDGYHVDLITVVNDIPRLRNRLDSLGVKYSSINSYLSYDYIVDTRSLMSYSEINWTKIFHQIYQYPMMDYLHDSIDVDYTDLLTISEIDYNNLNNEGLISQMYPNAPTTFKQLSIIQDYYKQGIDYIDLPMYVQDLVDAMKLNEFF